jgi:hypothetical protein
MGILKPAWQSEDKSKAISSVESQSDPRALVKIVRKADLTDVRVAAVKKLTDQAALAEIAKDISNGKECCLTAVHMLTDQALIIDVIKSFGDADVWEAAVGKLEDKSILSDLTNLSAVTSRGFAVKMLEDPEIIADTAQNDPSADVRKLALCKLTDQALLLKIAKTDKDPYVRKDAVGMLADQGELAKIAKADKSADVCRAAIGKIAGRDALTDIAKYAAARKARRAAIDKLADASLFEYASPCGPGGHDWENFIKTCTRLCKRCGEREQLPHVRQITESSYYKDVTICGICGEKYENWKH